MTKWVEQAKENLFPPYTYMIEPAEPVETPEEICEEISRYFAEQGKEISIIRKEPLPVIMLEGQQYIARKDRFVGIFGMGRKVDEEQPANYYGGALGNSTGYKFIYLYPYSDSEDEEK